MVLSTFTEALQSVPNGTTPHVLLGNGFSRACREDIFNYGALFDRADFNSLSPLVRDAFGILGTTDFEVVMRALKSAARLLSIYAPDHPEIAAQISRDATGLREILVRAIAENHPDRPGDIASARYASCRRFLAHFKNIYTLNYDLLLYWALMNGELPPPVECDDGFRTPETGTQDYVTWDSDRHSQNVYYLHGALHIFDARTEIQKYTWANTGIRLIDQIRSALTNNLYPIFVAEGASDQKFEHIQHSAFLSKAYRSFQAIGGTLLVYGHAMAPSDHHVIRLIGRGRKIKQLLVGIYGDPESDSNRQIVSRVDELRAMRPSARPLQASFFDADTAQVWG
ncbi:MAG TPA: DUF4917 family protein [Vicinamibacterales bacterium]|nr:DUF4917 family protein [Vicinamibacterales bacterium]